MPSWRSPSLRSGLRLSRCSPLNQMRQTNGHAACVCPVARGSSPPNPRTRPRRALPRKRGSLRSFVSFAGVSSASLGRGAPRSSHGRATPSLRRRRALPPLARGPPSPLLGSATRGPPSPLLPALATLGQSGGALRAALFSACACPQNGFFSASIRKRSARRTLRDTSFRIDTPTKKHFAWRFADAHASLRMQSHRR